MDKIRPKSLEEAKVIQNQIKTEFKIQTVLIVIVSILALIVSFRCMSLGIDYEALNKEKQALEDLTIMQSDTITKLREDNRNLGTQIEEMKEEYVY